MLTYAGIVLYFLLMKLCGWEEIVFLRVLNIGIVVFMTNRLAKLNLSENPNLEYHTALGSLFLANGLAVVLSVASFAFYAKIIDPSFMAHFRGGVLWDTHITLSQALASLVLEGAASSFIVSFVVMQYWKDAKAEHRIPERPKH